MKSYQALLPEMDTGKSNKERINCMIKKLKEPIRQKNLVKVKGAILTSLLLGLALLPAVVTRTVRAHNGGHGDSDGSDNPDSIVGTWLVRVSLDPGSVPPNVPMTFTSIETYGADGSYLESNNGPAAGGPGGQGSWAATGHRRFAVTELRLGFDPASHYTGLNKIRREVRLEAGGDEITGNVLADITLPDGTIAPFHPAGTFHGTRVPIETVN